MPLYVYSILVLFLLFNKKKQKKNDVGTDVLLDQRFILHRSSPLTLDST